MPGLGSLFPCLSGLVFPAFLSVVFADPAAGPPVVSFSSATLSAIVTIPTTCRLNIGFVPRVLPVVIINVRLVATNR